MFISLRQQTFAYLFKFYLVTPIDDSIEIMGVMRKDLETPTGACRWVLGRCWGGQEVHAA